MFDVSVIIVNYNVKDILDNCIASIYKSNNTNLNIEIFVVDNNSIDGSQKLIKEKYPEVKLIVNKENIGFSKANNIALKQATGKYILILNPDTVLEEGTFQKLIGFIKNNPNTGVVTSKLIKANGELDGACKRSFPTLSVAIPRMLGLSKLFPKSKIFGKYNLTYLDENQTYEVDSVCGAFMFIPKEVLDEVGFFDEDYFMYGEDIDLCYRIKKTGRKIFYYPEITTIHLKGESTRKTKLSYVNNFYGAMAIFVKKNLKGLNILTYLLLRFGIFVRSLLSYIKRIIKYVGLVLLDIFLIFSSLIFAVYTRFSIFPKDQYLFIITVYVIIWILLLSLFGVYSKKYKHSIRNTFSALVAGFFINSSITYFFKEYAFSRIVILIATSISLVTLLSWRILVLIHNFIKQKNILLRKINLLVVGDKELSQNMEEKLAGHYEILYFSKLSENKTISDLEEIIDLYDIHIVVFSGHAFSNRDILRLMSKFRGKNVQFKFVPTDMDLIISKISSKIDDLNLIEIEYNINNKLNIFLKRTFDIILSLILLIFVYPFIYLYYKIAKEKPTKYTSKLLLLPNVFIGKYSFVGMPIWYEKTNSQYLGKKGLTGIIQLKYNENLTQEEIEKYVIYYARNQSLLLDLEIILKTLFSFIRNKK
ncbi:MAG: glycosyltransferase [Ignavibacteria bacterium]|nr:glycosyltransferase [Ignavibacteria bacterium]